MRLAVIAINPVQNPRPRGRIQARLAPTHVLRSKCTARAGVPVTPICYLVHNATARPAFAIRAIGNDDGDDGHGGEVLGGFLGDCVWQGGEWGGDGKRDG